MKLKANIAGKDHAVTFDFNQDSASVRVDERAYELEIRETSPGVYLLVNGTEVIRCRVESTPNNTFSVAVGGKGYEVEITDPKRLRSGKGAGGHDHGSAEITSPMPGKVVRVLVEAGAQVEAGAGILVVEAMKMQNELKTPKAGVVQSINTQAGATVAAGEVLATIE